MNAIDVEGIIRTSGKRSQWVAAGKVHIGTTVGGADARWYEPLLAPADVGTLTPLQQGQKAAAGHSAPTVRARAERVEPAASPAVARSRRS